ncbi:MULTISPECIES: Stk1 family PASTA domain-containing Ser/Thr kinase [Acetobacterium]|jgi:serine/threonine-protein kinase|uniref:Stk1 family PASTA domain-containing Ser/Thr kinase n=1 Tax=Acetobacterium TaxID=33951 RepID=UPI000B9D4C9D|nr:MULTISPECIES: Stk1 family PASTA domain-containing Ser/Thr kinase [Acetobacterium]MEA4804729.1 Stk1 family PASTA domain-containing Ser/Thr kinase [Acetobacterium wieringae]OXS25527.1 MAG: serine/threonine protein kinase [Acetobacterium sp. MES1]URN83013.1 Stk1 family PASTA domain-containing Ser/Thr kinase [Acetobacterium wieringae]
MLSRTLGKRYEIVELIGRGGMAYVYKARDLKLNRYVAVKVLREEYTENEQFIKKFDRESQAVACLSHPNIVGVYDVGVQDNIYYIIMEYVDGITLKQYLMRKGRLDYTEATRFVMDISNALRCAHENKIIHRDIKPHNILLTRDLVPKVADFGIARAITSSTVTMTNQTMGSVHYISPEQAKGGFVDERSDLYSLGILYYELLTGKLPFDEENTVTIAIKHIQEEIVPPKLLEPKIPERVNQIVVKLTQKKPDERYQNTDELMEDLESVLENMSFGAGDGNHLGNDTHIIREGLFHVENTGSHATVQPEEEDDDDYYYETPKETAARKKKRKIILISVFAAVAIIAMGVMAFAFFSGKTVEVPDIKGKTTDEAKTALEKLDLVLEVEKEVYNADVEAGLIITQNPESGKELQSGKTVKVTVSKGVKTGTIPSVIGLSETEAVKAIEAANFVVGEIKREYNSNYNAEIVFQMNPNGNTTANEGTKVTIYVSKGEDLVTVPSVVGQTEADAKSTITNAGLTVGTITHETSTDYAKGMVMKQSPTDGNQVSKGSEIAIVVSSGKVSTQKLTIDLSEYIQTTPAKSVKVKVVLTAADKTETVIYEGTNMSDDVFSVNVEGVGRETYEVFIDGSSVGTGYIDF